MPGGEHLIEISGESRSMWENWHLWIFNVKFQIIQSNKSSRKQKTSFRNAKILFTKSWTKQLKTGTMRDGFYNLCAWLSPKSKTREGKLSCSARPQAAVFFLNNPVNSWYNKIQNTVHFVPKTLFKFILKTSYQVMRDFVPSGDEGGGRIMGAWSGSWRSGKRESYVGGRR